MWKNQRLMSASYAWEKREWEWGSLSWKQVNFGEGSCANVTVSKAVLGRGFSGLKSDTLKPLSIFTLVWKPSVLSNFHKPKILYLKSRCPQTTHPIPALAWAPIQPVPGRREGREERCSTELDPLSGISALFLSVYFTLFSRVLRVFK